MLASLVSLLLLQPPSGGEDVSSVLYYCQKVAMARSLDVHGSYTLKVRTDEEGRITALSVVKDTVSSDVMERCLRTKMLGLRVGKGARTTTMMLRVPAWKRQHAVWLNDVPMTRTLAPRVMARAVIHPKNTGMAVPGLAVVKVMAGATLPAHFHVASDAFLYVLSGNARCSWSTAPGKVRQEHIGEGDAVWIPAGVPHEIRAVKDTVVAVFMPGPRGFEWFRGEPSDSTRVVPPPGVPSSGPSPNYRAGRRAVVWHAPRKGRPRVRRFSPRHGWRLAVVAARPGRSLKLRGRAMTAFVMTGVGTVRGDGDSTEPFQGGSAVAAERSLVLEPLKRNVPIRVLVLGRGRLSVSFGR